jgi:hypothetical protein
VSGLRDLLAAGDELDAVLGMTERAKRTPGLAIGADAIQAARVEWARASAIYRAALQRDETKGGAA